MFSVTTWQKLLWLELQEAQENPFLKISKTLLQKENQMHPMYTSILGWLQNHWKLQMSKNSSKLENKWPQNAAIQSYIVYKKSNFKSDEHPTPSNTCWLHSRQKVHVRHKGTAPYRSALRGLPKLPFQPANNPITLLGIAQWSPNKQNTSDHRCDANSQWRRKWHADSPHLLHMHATPLFNTDISNEDYPL